MLQSIRLENFKSFVSEEVALAPLTVLVGANASGKSNLLEAIRFVQGLGLGFSALDVLQGRWEAGREVWKGLRGGMAEAVRHGQSTACILMTWELEGQSWQHEVALETRPEPRHVESFGPAPLERVPLERKIPPGTTMIPLFRPGSMLRTWAQVDAKDMPDLDARAPSAAAHIISSLESSLFLTLSPERMRGYSPKQVRRLGAEGENLSSVLWSLCQDESAREEWVDWLGELLAPELKDIDFIETELGDVLLALVESDGARTSARGLSDGTLRFLGTLVALRTLPEGSFILLEEPETGLHPQRLHLLVEFLEAVTRQRHIQVIATTHSPQVLQALSLQARRDAVLCARLPGQPGTLLRRLGDLPHFDEVSQRSHLDHLFSTGWLERAL